tara:strand:- start:11939 stop:12208 length:270 start_codon:yes stop_codon:yes gene_type:complete
MDNVNLIKSCDLIGTNIFITTEYTDNGVSRIDFFDIDILAIDVISFTHPVAGDIVEIVMADGEVLEIYGEIGNKLVRKLYNSISKTMGG